MLTGCWTGDRVCMNTSLSTGLLTDRPQSLTGRTNFAPMQSPEGWGRVKDDSY